MMSDIIEKLINIGFGALFVTKENIQEALAKAEEKLG